VFALVDRIALPQSPTPEMRQRLVDSTEICFRESVEVIFESAAGGERHRYSEQFSCKGCGASFVQPEPSLFSFNSPFGACPRCQGFGNTVDYDRDLIVPDPSLSLQNGAVNPWTKPQYQWYYNEFRTRYRGKVRLGVPFAGLSAEEKETVWREVRDFFADVETKKYKVHVRVFLSRYRGYTDCQECGGGRLRREALNIRLAGKTVAEVVRMNIAQACAFFDSLQLPPERAAVAEKVLVEIRQRMHFLNDVGLEYLTLDRLSATLSGGEAQRIQLATCLGSRLVGAAYVLDEPSIGLHSRDTHRLLRILRELRDLGNSIVVVEHDADIMRAADHVIDLGPGAGEHGGEVVFAGPRDQLFAPGVLTLTARYLSGELAATRRSLRKGIDRKRLLRFEGCRAHNLKDIDVEIPLGRMVAVTGVSGSGKSTLVHECIHKTLTRMLRLPAAEPGNENGFGTAEKQTVRRALGLQHIESVVLVDQSPIGRTPRSNPITYIKAFDIVRELFAATPEASRRGYSPGHFSFNVPGGRCETCQGDGTVTVEMQFLADVELVCEDCHGTRFKSGILDVPYQGRNIHQVLQLTVDEALTFFANTPKLAARLRVLADVGLGYLRLGQSATTLSGGEAQRVKLAAHLAQASCQGALFLFDEPTTGLHFDDIAKLLQSFQRLIDSGGSVLIIEHNLDVIRSADWIIDLGPEGGDDGGQVVVCGPPEVVAGAAASHTGRFLKHVGGDAGREVG